MEEDLLGSLDWYDKSPREIIFQQDNDPKHKCLVCREWYKDNGIKLLSFPAQSVDIAPIEHLWSHLKKRLKEYIRKNTLACYLHYVSYFSAILSISAIFQLF